MLDPSELSLRIYITYTYWASRSPYQPLIIISISFLVADENWYGRPLAERSSAALVTGVHYP